MSAHGRETVSAQCLEKLEAFFNILLEPVVDEKERRPQTRMSMVGVLEKRDLRLLQSDGFRYGGVLEVLVECRYEVGRRFIFNEPKGGKSAFCTRCVHASRDARQS